MAGAGFREGFTLIELLVVIAIIGALTAILLPALHSVRVKVRGLHCASSFKSVVTEFGLFVDGQTARGRGDSAVLGGPRFWMNDFQESLYGLDEFWDAGQSATAQLRAGAHVMLCLASGPTLEKRRGYPCGAEALAPVSEVSVAMNMRLYRGVVTFQGKRVLAPASATHVRTSILHHPYVPLVLDVDGAEASRRGLEPFYTAPAASSEAWPGDGDPYGEGRFWMPSKRHGGRVNVGFVGGHVLTSERPEQERWDWTYQGDVGR